MNAREIKGNVLADLCKIEPVGNGWAVPSQTGNGKYFVRDDSDKPSCTCPDFELRGGKCKHIFAVMVTRKRIEDAKGNATIVTTVVIAETVRKTYRQDWPNYNAAQMNEKTHFQELLHDLCQGIVEPPQSKGRPRLSLRDCVFSAAFKVYTTVSCRRFTCDLKDAKEKGFVKDAPHYNSIFRCLESESLTPILQAMILESSKPLATVETDFATDSTGFTTCRYERWFDHKYGCEKKAKEWVKCHFTCGVKTNIITAVVIKDKNAADSPLLPEMLKTTAKNFTVKEFSADMGYISKENYEAIEKVGAKGYIPFKSNATGAVGGIYEKMFHYFSFKRDEFMQHYHKRSNVESTVSMVKRKFGDFVRSKSDVAMTNEVLCKILCHNLVVLIHEMYELGIEPVFWTKTVSA
jgi:transposase